MASITMNISKGRETEFYQRIVTNDPTNSAFILLVLRTGSVNGIGGLLDFDTVAAITAGGYTEVTNTGYGRKTLTNADLVAWAPDDTNNRVLLTLPLQTFSTIIAGDIWDLLVVGYRPDTTTPSDATTVPVTAHELRIDGSPIPGIGTDILVDLSTGWVMAT